MVVGSPLPLPSMAGDQVRWDLFSPLPRRAASRCGAGSKPAHGPPADVQIRLGRGGQDLGAHVTLLVNMWAYGCRGGCIEGGFTHA